jgi:hypothetical protein
MTLTRRQTIVGAAATVALPAVAAADAANIQVEMEPRHRLRDVVVGYTDRNGCEWFGSYDLVEMIRDLDEADLITNYVMSVRLAEDSAEVETSKD